jgi:hypothetical protein
MEIFIEGRVGLGRPVDVAQIGNAADAGAGHRADQSLGLLQTRTVILAE